MSSEPGRSRRRTVTILVLTAAVGMLLVAGAFGGWKVRKSIMVRKALTTGNAAYEQADWETARRMLGRYLSAYPDDAQILAKYAHAQLSVRPLPRANIVQALSAYRRVLRINPRDEAAFRRLALVYETVGEFAELAEIAAHRRAVLPDDPAAALAAAKSLLPRQKSAEARAELEKLVHRLASGGEKRPEFVEACVLLSELAARTAEPGEDRARAERALAWLNRAVEYAPDSPRAYVQRAALRRELAQRAQREADAAEQRRDLEKAETLAMTDPRVRLLLSEEWMALGAFDRAAAQLEAAKQVAPKTLEDYFVDPDDWVAAQFVQAGKLALLTAAGDQGVKLAQEVLDRLKDRPQRVQILPAAVELFVAGKQTEQARKTLDEYLEAAKLAQNTAEREEQAAYLQAIVDRADNQPYRVIDLLGPLADRPTVRPMIRALLAEAYARTGQTGRAAKVLSRSATEQTLNVDMAKLLARSYLQRGAWVQALGVLSPLARSPGADVDTKLLELGARFGASAEEPTPAQNDALDAVVNELTALQESHPQRIDIRMLLASIAERRGRPEAAEAELRQARAECPEPLPAILALAWLFTNAQRFEEARQVLQAACQEHGAQAAPWLALSDFLVNREQVDEARETLRAALDAVSLPEEKRKLTIKLALIDVRRGDPAAGMTALHDLVSRDPKDTEVRGLLLEMPRVLRDRAAAQQLVDEIKRVEGGSGVLWRLHQARLWLAGEDWRSRQKEIEDLLKYCIDADSGRTAPVLVLGGMYEQVGDLAGAEAVYANSFKLNGAPEVADRLLPLLQRQKRFTEARDVLDKVKQKLDERALGARRVALALGEGQFGEAINELELRVAGADKDPLDLVRLAGLTYGQNRELKRALDYLDQAVAIGADLTAVARMRVSLLKAEKRFDEAEAVLDELARTKPTPEAFLLRAAYHASVERADLAEQDYLELVRLAKDAFGHAVLGEFYAQSKRLDQAINTWQEGLKQYPDSTVLKRGLTKALLIREQPGDRDLAGKLLTELQQSLPDDTDLLWVQVVQKAGEGTPEAAGTVRELLKKAVRSRPAAAETYRGLASVALRLEEFVTARDLALRGLQAGPDDASLRLLQAQAEFGLQHLDVAGELARSVLTNDNQKIAAHALLIEVARRRPDAAALQSELASVEQLLAREPSNETLQLMRTRVQIALGQKDAALTALEEFRGSDAGRVSLPVLLALQDLYRLKGDFAMAHERLDAASALAPDQPAVLHARLLLFADQKRFDDIMALMNDWSGGANPRPDILVSAATILANSPPHLDGAIKLAQRAAELAPHDARAHLTVGDLVYQQGDAGAAEQAFRDALQDNPSLPEALNNLAWVLAENPRGAEEAFEEALVHARQAVALRPEDANFRDTLGFVWKKLGKLEEARTEFRRSVDLAPAGSALRAKSLLHLAQVCFLLKELGPTEDYLKDALATENGAAIFSPSERDDINRMLRDCKKPR